MTTITAPSPRESVEAEPVSGVLTGIVSVAVAVTDATALVTATETAAAEAVEATAECETEADTDGATAAVGRTVAWEVGDGAGAAEKNISVPLGRNTFCARTAERRRSIGTRGENPF